MFNLGFYNLLLARFLTKISSQCLSYTQSLSHLISHSNSQSLSLLIFWNIFIFNCPRQSLSSSSSSNRPSTFLVSFRGQNFSSIKMFNLFISLSLSLSLSLTRLTKLDRCTLPLTLERSEDPDRPRGLIIRRHEGRYLWSMLCYWKSLKMKYWWIYLIWFKTQLPLLWGGLTIQL